MDASGCIGSHRGARRGLWGGLSTLALTTQLALAEEPAPVDRPGDIVPLCGSKPTIAALLDGTGDNIWRRVTRYKFEALAKRCPNVTKVIYAEAGNDQQRYNAAVNSLTAQGADILVTFTDYGDASLPAFRKATQAGVTVVPYFGRIGGVAGKDYAFNLYVDLAKQGRIWADWIGSTVPKGNVAFLGGVPGSTTSKQYIDTFAAGLAKYPGVRLLDPDYVVANWNAADAQRAMAGLIAKYGRIDAVVTDYGTETLGAVRAFEQAGLAVPPQATIASFNELNCKYLDAKKAGKPWKLISLDGTNRIVEFALRRAMAIRQGTKLDEPGSVVAYVSVDSEKGLDPVCDPAAPLDADFTTGLPREVLHSLFKR